MSTDRIEKQVLLRAPLERVWRALSDSTEFGRWFGVKFDGPFVAGTVMRGSIQPTTVDPDVAKAQEPYRGLQIDIIIERIEPQRLLSYRWHPGAVDPALDYSVEPTTLVVFELEEVAEGVLLKVTETGFDRIPLERRAKAYESNDGGWSAQMKLIDKYVRNAG